MQLQDFELDEGVVLRSNALSRSTVVVGTWLPVLGGVDRIALVFDHPALCGQRNAVNAQHGDACVWYACSMKHIYSMCMLKASHLLLEGVELPAHKAVVVRVDVGGDKATAPINAAAHGGHVALGQGGEVLQPMQRIAGEMGVNRWW